MEIKDYFLEFLLCALHLIDQMVLFFFFFFFLSMPCLHIVRKCVKNPTAFCNIIISLFCNIRISATVSTVACGIRFHFRNDSRHFPALGCRDVKILLQLTACWRRTMQVKVLRVRDPRYTAIYHRPRNRYSIIDLESNQPPPETKDESSFASLILENILVIIIFISVAVGLALGVALRSVWSHDDYRKIHYLEVRTWAERGNRLKDYAGS